MTAQQATTFLAALLVAMNGEGLSDSARFFAETLHLNSDTRTKVATVIYETSKRCVMVDK